MQNPISPGLYVNELEFPQFQQAVGGTRVCIIGGATKGPVNKPTLVSSQGALVEKFGVPTLNDYGLQSAVQFLNGGYQLVFMRVANGAATASRNVAGTTGGSAAGRATGFVQLVGSVNPNDGDTVTVANGTITRVFEFDNNNASTGGNVAVGIGSTAAATIANLITAINGSGVATAVDGTTTAPRANLTSSVAGTAGNVTITVSVGAAASLQVSGMAGGTAAVAGTGANVVTFTAASPGSWGNTVRVQVVAPSAVPTAPADNFDIVVYAPPLPGSDVQQVERFANVSLDPASDRFVESLLANGVPNEFGASRYIAADALTTGTPTAGTYQLGTAGGTAGADGISGLTPADYVGTVVGQNASGLKAVRNPESVEYNILLIPGVSHATVVNALIEHAEYRQDHLVLIDPPFGLDASTLKAWVDGQQPGGVPNSPAAPLSSSYASVAWPWHKVYDAFNRKNVWVPPSAFSAQIMAKYGDAPWLPAAGPNRGVVNSLDIETSPDESARTLLYESGVNCFVKFPVGVMRYGNKTLQRTTTATQSEHARRTLIAAKKMVAGSVAYLQFEPNDPLSWRQFESLGNVALGSLRSARGLKQFSVVCDVNTNPPEARARKEMHGYIVAQPVDVAEKIVMSFASTSTGTTFGNEQIDPAS